MIFLSFDRRSRAAELPYSSVGQGDCDGSGLECQSGLQCSQKDVDYCRDFGAR